MVAARAWIRAALVLAIALGRHGAHCRVVSNLAAAAGLSPRLGRFDLAPSVHAGDDFETLEGAQRLCSSHGLPARLKPARLVETFPFQREVDLLAVKLRELHGVVDHFVLVESAYTFAGKPSRTMLREGLLNGLGSWLHTSVHPVTLTEQGHLTELINDGAASAVRWRALQSAAAERSRRDRWGQEFHRRQVGIDFAMQRLGIGDDDVVVLSDADELMSREAAGVLKHCDWKTRPPVSSTAGMASPLMSVHYFGLDHYLSDMSAPPIALVGSYVRRVGSAAASWVRARKIVSRDAKDDVHPWVFAEGGWHMSFFSSPTVAARKMRDSSHFELITDRTTDRSRIEACMASGTDAWGRATEPQFVSPADAAEAQGVIPGDTHRFYYGRHRVPRLMQEHEGVFGERRGWLPGWLRRNMSSAALESLRAECLSLLF